MNFMQMLYSRTPLDDDRSVFRQRYRHNHRVTFFSFVLRYSKAYSAGLLVA